MSDRCFCRKRASRHESAVDRVACNDLVTSTFDRPWTVGSAGGDLIVSFDRGGGLDYDWGLDHSEPCEQLADRMSATEW